MWCWAYLIGVADTMTVFGKGGHKAGICGVSYDVERLQQVFTTWAQQHPELQIARFACRRQSRLSGGLALRLNLVRHSLLLPPMWMVLASGLLPAEPSSPFSIPNWLSGCELSGSNDLAWP